MTITGGWCSYLFEGKNDFIIAFGEHTDVRWRIVILEVIILKLAPKQLVNVR